MRARPRCRAHRAACSREADLGPADSGARQSGASSPAVVAQASPQQLPAVQVQGNYENAVGTSDAASEGTVTSKLIESRPTLRPAEVLEFVPGVIVTQHSGDGKANQYFLRGFNLDHGTDFATFVDGMPVNMPTHAHGQGYSDLNFLIPELVDRIELPQGPVLRRRGRLLVGRRGAHRALRRDCRAASRRSRSAQDRYARALRRELERRSAAARCSTRSRRPQQRAVGQPGEVPSHQRRAALQRSATTANRSSVTAMGYSASWNSTDQIPQRAVDAGLIGRFGAIDPTDGGAPSATASRTDIERTLDDGAFKLERLRDPVAPGPVLQLHLLPRASDRPRPTRSTATSSSRPSGARVFGLAASRSWNTPLGGRETINTRRPAGAPRPARPGRPVRDGRARSAPRRRRRARVRETSVGLYAENATQWTPWLRSVAGAARRPLRLRRRELDRRRTAARGAPASSRPKLSLIFGPVDEDRILRQLRPRLPQQRRARRRPPRSTPRSGDPARSGRRRSCARRAASSACAPRSCPACRARSRSGT